MGKLSNLRASQVAPVIKKPPANAGDKRDSGSISGLWSCPGGGRGNPLQYSWLENPMDRGAWRATVHGVAESDMIKQLRTQAAIWKNMLTDFPGSPMVKTPSFHFRGQAFNPQSGNKHPACHRMRQKKKKRTYSESPNWHVNRSVLVVERGCSLPCAPQQPGGSSKFNRQQNQRSMYIPELGECHICP